MRDMTAHIDACIANLAKAIEENRWALEAARAEILYLKEKCDEAHHVLKNAYTSSNGEVLSLYELSKRFAEWEYRFTDDHR
jgi:hypothetical protein